MNTLTTALLLDGALLTSTSLLQSLRDDPAAIALYADLPEGADQVGPWIWPGHSLKSVSASMLALPHRHGVSQLDYEIETSALIAHWRHHRLVSKPDGSRYYLRFADMRTVIALREALPPARMQSMLGPLHRWSWIDRYGVMHKLERRVDRVLPFEASRPIALSDEQFQRMNDAAMADRLAIALAELEESGLHPDLDAMQFRHVETAAHWLQKHRVSAYRLRRAVARQAVWSQGAVLNQPRFAQDVCDIAAGGGDPRLIDRWTLGEPANQGEPSNA